MALTSPPHGLRLQELGDRMLVHFRPRRSGVGGLGVWLTLWTLAGVSTINLVVAGKGPTDFFLLWLCGWAIGECAVVAILAWKLFGREVLTISPEALEGRREACFFRTTRHYDVGLVDGDFVAALVPTGEDDQWPRTDYRLELSYSGSTIRVGEGMSESEAQEFASILNERLRPHSWWNDERGSAS